MKLGFILFDYFPFGGLQRDCVKIARACANRGHSVTLLTRTWQGERPSSLDIQVSSRRGFSNPGRNRHFLRHLDTRLPTLELHGVIGFNKMPGLDVYFGADPCYRARIERTRASWYRWLPRFRHFCELERSVFAAGQSTQILLLTPHEIPFYQKFYGTESERFHVLPPGIARQEFSADHRLATRQRLRIEHGWSDQDRLLLLVGSGFRVKGLDRAISGLAALPAELARKTRLVVIGQNSTTKFFRQARKLGVADRIHFLGGRLDVPDWLLAADLCFHPAYSESAGMILLEALAAGLPVLTTDTCGYAFHVTNAQAGMVLPSPFSQDTCNRALAEMLTSDKQAIWLANGMAYAAREDLYTCHERAVDIIEETVQQKLRVRAEPA